MLQVKGSPVQPVHNALEENQLNEVDKSGEGFKVNTSEFNSISEDVPTGEAEKVRYDPRRRQLKHNPLRQRQAVERKPMRNRSAAEKLHFQIAKTQLQQAIKLQACLADPSVCPLLF